MERSSQFSYCYEIFPVNFVMLPDEKQDRTIDFFRRFLNALSAEVRFHVVRTARVVDVGGTPIETRYYRFFVESKSPIEHLLEMAGFRYQRVLEVPTVEPVRVFRKWMAMPDGVMIQALTVYALPSTLVEGVISETYGLVDRVVCSIEPLPPDRAVVKMRKYLRLLRGIVLADRAAGRMTDDAVRMRVEMAEETFRHLASGATRLFRVKVNFCVAGKDRTELAENAKRLREVLEGRMIRVDTPSFIQLEVAKGVQGKALAMDTATAACFFPFVSADLIESPGGVFLGVNRLTGAPVIYDVSLRMNQNILVVGKPGAGKSFTMKILATRYATKDKRFSFFLIDPENEYRYMGERLGAKVLEVSPGSKLGLDPVQLFESKDSAASIIADIAGIEGKPYQALRALVGTSADIFEVYEKAPPEIKDSLDPFVVGADSWLIQGEPLKFGRRMVFNLNKLWREYNNNPERSVILHAASILLFGKIWTMIDNPEVLPLGDPKFVGVDEVWLYTGLPASARFLEGVSRRGRKRNVIFTLCSQRVADVYESPAGRALMENCVTKVILRQDEAAIRLAGEVFGLSDAEKEAALDFKQGQGLLITEETHIPVDFVATEEEYRLFTTKPTERIVE